MSATRETLGVIVLIEVAAAEERDAEDLEIAGADDVELGNGLLRGVGLLAFDEELIVEGGRFIERKVAGGGDGSDAGKGCNFFDKGIEEAECFLVGGVAREIQAELNGQNIFGAEARVDMLEVDEATHREAGADEEEEGDGDLRDDECAAEFAAGGAESGLAATFF